MDKQHKVYGLVALILLGQLSGCRFKVNKDGYPSSTPNLSKVTDPIPTELPKSKYGNPEQYTVFKKSYNVLPSSKDFKETGVASFYGTKFHGRRTSSGETYDMYKMTAAHKTLPLPTFVEVTNLDNNRSVIVKVNDRGPFKDDRVIDLSYSAAFKLGILENGTGNVSVEAIDPKTWNQRVIAKNEAKKETNKEPSTSNIRKILAKLINNPSDRSISLNNDNETFEGPIITKEPVVTAEVSKTVEVAPVKETANVDTSIGFSKTPALKLASNAAAKNIAKANKSGKSIYLQLGAFRNKQNALRLTSKANNLVAENAFIEEIQSKNGPIYKVRIGPMASKSSAASATTVLGKNNIEKPLVVLH